MRKVLSVILLLCVLLGMFSGCQQTAEDAPEPTTQMQNIFTEPEPFKNTDIYPLTADRTYTIATPRADAGNMDVMKLWQRVVGLDIQWQRMAGNQVSEALQDGTSPDAYYFMNGVSKKTIYEMGSEGRLVNFLDYLELMPNFRSYLAKDPDILACAISPDGKLYTLPQISNTTTVSGNLLYLRTDMLEQAGWTEAPKTTEDFLRFAKDIQLVYQSDPEYYAVVGADSGAMNWDSGTFATFLFPSFGELMQAGMTFEGEGEIILGGSTEQYKHYLAFMNELYESGAFYRDIWNADDGIAKAKIASNKCAVTNVASNLTADNFESGNVDMVLLEPLTSPHYDQKHWLPASTYNFSVNMISTTCIEVEPLIRWMDSFYATKDNPLNPEGTVWGVSPWLGELGVDYTVDEATGTYALLPHEDYGIPSQWQSANTYGNAIGLGEFMYINASGTGLEVKSRGTVENLMPYAVDMLRLTSLPMTAEQQDIYAQYWHGISAYIDNQSKKFITGEWDTDKDWDRYLHDLEEKGLAEMIGLYQEVLKNYRESLKE